MNKQEAIRILGETKLCSPLGQACFVGIEALKKQIPKKRYIRFPYSYCPVCNENITDESPNYCPECGQAIDWEGDDEYKTV